MPINNVQIICKPEHEEARKLAENIAEWLNNRKISCKIGWPQAFCKADLYLVLGGDGTMLGVARKLVNANIPILGINFGHVGFLTSLQPNDWKIGLEAVINESFPETRCAALTWHLTHKNGEILSGAAINEVVISRGNLARLVNLRIDINGFSYDTIRCDGIIICTPLGSSGYNASCGGPLIDPAQQSLCYTVICPFMVKTNPLVMPMETIFTISSASTDKEYFLTIDGQDGMPMKHGDKVTIYAIPGAVRLIGPKEHFLTRLISLNRSKHGKL